MFTQDFIDKVRDAISIVSVISEFTELKRSGSGLVGLCPFPSHKEKTASFSVSDLKQAYYCFGCQKHGNVYTFLREMRGMSFPEAVEFLADRAHIPIPENQRAQNASAQSDTKIFSRINQMAADFYHKLFMRLPESHPARVYAAKRDLNSELIQQFQIGLSGSTNELARYLQSQKVPMEQADKIGLVKPSRDGHGYYDMFRGRLMFPIQSVSGSYIGFGGRVLDDSLPKYLNSPETPVFSKGRTLYGLNETAKFIRTDDFVLVVEGYMDFLGLYQAGVRNVVATLGTALTKEHAQVLKRHTKNVVVLFDGDSAGQKASFRSLPVLLSEGLFPRAVSLPDKLDPDDFVKKQGAEALRSLIRTAPELFFHFVESLLQKYGRQPSDKVHLIQELSSVLNVTSEAALRDLYVAEVARRLDVQTAWLKKVLDGKMESSAPRSVPTTTNKSNFREKNSAAPSTAKTKPKTKFPREERLLINLALWKEKYLKELTKDHTKEPTSTADDFSTLITDEKLRGVFGAIAEAYRQSPLDFDKLTVLLFNKFDETFGEKTFDQGNTSKDRKNDSAAEGGLEITEAITDHLNPRVFNFNEEEGDKLFKDCLTRMKDNAFKLKAKDLIQGLKKDRDNSKLEQFVNAVRNRSTDRTK